VKGLTVKSCVSMVIDTLKCLIVYTYGHDHGYKVIIYSCNDKFVCI
jgi:hypothetical protein